MLVRPLLESSTSTWDPHLIKDFNKIEKVQRRAAKLLPRHKSLSTDQRLSLLNWQNLKDRRTYFDLIQICVSDDAVTRNVKCKLCGQFSALVTQMNCPLGDSVYHRVLYIYCCVNVSCWNKSESWCAIRCQIKDEEFSKGMELKKTVSTEDWLDGANSWVDSDHSSNDINLGGDLDDVCSNMENIAFPPLLTTELIPEAMEADSEDQITDEIRGSSSNVIAETIEFKTPEQNLLQMLVNKPGRSFKDKTFQPVFRPFYIAVTDEPAEETQTCSYEAEHVRKLLADYETGSGNPFLNAKVSSKNKNVTQESYEKSEIKHGDKDFYRFCKRVNRCPTQIIRYCFDGLPLHICNKNELPLLCQYCGSDRVFEFQLMPALIRSLMLNNSAEINPNEVIEFGTVLVYSCRKSCWSDENVAKFETVIVEADLEDYSLNTK